MAGRLPRVTGATGSVDTAGEGGFFAGTLNPTTVSLTAALGANNRVLVSQFVLPFRVVVGKIVFDITTASAAGLASVGIYDKDKNRLLHAGAVSTTVAELKSVTLGTSVTLEPGVYFVAHTADNNTAQFRLHRTETSVLLAAFMTKNANRMGRAANNSVSGVLPATLGAITPIAQNIVGAYFEP